jgi:hypothetical protein
MGAAIHWIAIPDAQSSLATQRKAMGTMIDFMVVPFCPHRLAKSATREQPIANVYNGVEKQPLG